MTGRRGPGIDGLRRAAAVSTPTLFVHRDRCALPDDVRRVHDALRCARQLGWGGGGQTDYYDLPAAMQFALEAVDAHFKKTL